MTFELHPLAMDGRTQKPLQAIKWSEFLKGLRRQRSWRLLLKMADKLRLPEHRVYRDEEGVHRRREDPRSCGWRVLMHEEQPQRQEILQVLTPLHRHRLAGEAPVPLLIPQLETRELQAWIEANVRPARNGFRPFLLIVGSPRRIPFAVQGLLSSRARVGRLDFDDLSDLEDYVRKVISYEKAAKPVAERRFLCLAPHDGQDFATSITRGHLAEAVLERARERKDLQVEALLDHHATVPHFLQALEKRPALVFTAGHGTVFPDCDVETQKDYNGSIICHSPRPDLPFADRTFSRDNVDRNRPLMPGSVLFQCGCFGAGTPATGGYSHLRGSRYSLAPYDFSAALPKRLLAHPQGPVAYIGHFDLAWVASLMAEEDLLNRERPQPFVRLIMALLSGCRVGAALDELNALTNHYGNSLTQRIDRRWQQGLDLGEPALRQMADTFLLFRDTQDYFLLGDPAVRVRIPRPPPIIDPDRRLQVFRGEGG